MASRSDTSFALRPPAQRGGSASIIETAHPLGVHDSLRHGGPRTLAAEAEAAHPLKHSLEHVCAALASILLALTSSKYQETQEALKLQIQRNVHGLHAPIRLAMEREIVSGAPSFSRLGKASNLHLDILLGRDEILGVEDVLGVETGCASAPQKDFHAIMERQLRI